MSKRDGVMCKLSSSDDGKTVTLTMTKDSPISNRQALNALAGFIQAYLNELESVAEDAAHNEDLDA